MSQEAMVRSQFERAEPRFLFGTLEPLLDVPPCPRRRHHLLKTARRGRVADEVLCFSLPMSAPGDDQPVLPIRGSRFRAARIDEMHTSCPQFPFAMTTRCSLDCHAVPIFVSEYRTALAGVVHAFRRVRTL